MAVITTIRINHGSAGAQHARDNLLRGSGNAHSQCNAIARFFDGVAVGNKLCSFDVEVDMAKATGTITFSDTGEASDTILVNGVTFTAVASGATGNQFNVGAKATKVIQDLTYTAKKPGSARNSITVAYTGGATAGAEVVSVVGNAISVQIENGVSTATQIKTAVDASGAAAALVSVTISGTAGNAQAVAAAANLAGGTGSATLTASSLASAINASATTLVSGTVSAEAASGVVTLTALYGGQMGNAITVAEGVDADSVISVSGARLTGGADSPRTFHCGV